MIANAARHAKAVPWAACCRWSASALLALAPLLVLHHCDVAQRPQPPVMQLELAHLPAARPGPDDAAEPAATRDEDLAPPRPPAHDTAQAAAGAAPHEAAVDDAPMPADAPGALREGGAAPPAATAASPQSAWSATVTARGPGGAADSAVRLAEPSPRATLRAPPPTPPTARRDEPPPRQPATLPASEDAAPRLAVLDDSATAEGLPLSGASAVDGSFRLLSLGALTYPPRARRMRIAGEARLELEIGADGQVRRVEVLSESGNWGFGAAARAAYTQAAFTPPTVDGRPVRVLWRKTLQFRP